MIDDYDGLPADILAVAVDDLDSIFVQEVLWETGCGSFLTASKRSVICTAWGLLPKMVLTSISEFTDLVRGLIDDVEVSGEATPTAENKVERQNRLVSSAQRSFKNALKDVSKLFECVAAAAKREEVLLSSSSATSGYMERDTAE